MPLHSTLSGTDLHESKGVAAASANTVAVADGLGSTTWKKFTTVSADSTSWVAINKMNYTVTVPSAAAISDFYIPFNRAGNVVRVDAALCGAITVTDLTITIRNGATIIGTITIPQAGSAAGTSGSSTISVNNAIALGGVLRLTTNAVTGAVPVVITVDVTNT